MWSFVIGSAVVALASVPGVLLLWREAKKRQDERIQTAKAVVQRRRYHQ